MDDDDDDLASFPCHRGKLQLNAYVCDADVKYPTNLDLLNKCRHKADELINDLSFELGPQDKPNTYKRLARNKFLNV